MNSRLLEAGELSSPCDQCLHRKIRCDRSLPRCRRCFDASLACTREVVRRRPGRKKGRGVVISRLKSLQNTTAPRCPSASSPSEQDLQASRETSDTDFALNAPTGQEGFLRHGRDPDEGDRVFRDRLGRAAFFSARATKVGSVLVPPTQFGSLTSRRSSFERPAAVLSNLPNLSPYVDLFFAKLYPIWPIIHESSIREYLYHPEQLGCHQTCLILAICALSAIHVPSSSSSTSENRRLIAQRFIDQCLQIRASFDYIETSNLITIQTSLFLSCCEVEFQRTRSSWFLLQEAIMLAEELSFNTRDGAGLDPNLSKSTILSIQRTLYLLSLTERGLTILRNKPYAMITFDSPPEERFEDEDPAVLVGLQIISRLFKLLDKQFLDTWVNGIQADTLEREEALAKVLAAQQTLSTMRLEQFEIHSLTDIQKADILITQQWLRLVFWQSCMRQGLLSSAAQEPVLSYQFPCHIAQSLCEVLKSLPTAAILIHGVAIFERIFEITYSYMDCLSISHSLPSGLEELRLLFRVLRESPNSHSTYIHILETKLMEQPDGDGERLIPLIYQSP